MIQLVLCDMDLTLVPFRQQTVTKLALEAIHALLDEGVHVAASSGRSFADLKIQFAGDEACVRDAVASNGCVVMAGGEPISLSPLPRAEVEAALEVVRGIRGAFFTADMDGVRVAVGEAQDLVNARFANWPGARFTVADRLPEGDLLKVNLTVDERFTNAREVVDRIAPLAPSIDFVVLGGHVADMMPKGRSKARGAQDLLDHYGLTASELLVFGDSENDLPLFCAFPRSCVAMANATAEVRDAARWHIGPCTEDACAQALLDLAKATHEGRDPAWMGPEANAAALHRALSDPLVQNGYLHSLWTKPAPNMAETARS